MSARKSEHTLGSRLAHWRAHHAREARAALRRLAATPFSTLLTLLVVALALALPASLSQLLANAGDLASRWGGQAQISVYLRQGTPADRLEPLRASLAAPADIAPAAVKRLRDSLVALPEAEAADIDLAWVQRLAALLELGQRLLWALAGALAATVLLVIGNTIRLGIEARKDEVNVLGLLGATDAFIRRPFLYTGFWTGLFGGVLACLAVAGFFFWLSGPVDELARLYQSSFHLEGPGIGGYVALLILSALLGILGAWLAVGRHLRALAP